MTLLQWFQEGLTVCRIAFDPVELVKAIGEAEFSHLGVDSAILAVANDEAKIFTATNPLIHAADLAVFHYIAKTLKVDLPPGT